MNLTVLDNKQVSLQEVPGAPLIVNITYFDQSQILLEECRKEKLPPFSLLTISNIQWDQELSPWPHAWCIETNDDFTGQADSFLAWIEQKALPWAKSQLQQQPSSLILCGYSMAGLFALYAGYQTGIFDQLICVSGSVWYPDFLAYCQSHIFVQKPKSVYMSLGKQEIKVRNHWLHTTGYVMETLESLYRSQDIPVVFQWNPGNHFNDVPGRIVLGIRWTLQQLQKDPCPF